MHSPLVVPQLEFMSNRLSVKDKRNRLKRNIKSKKDLTSSNDKIFSFMSNDDSKKLSKEASVERKGI